MKLLEGDVNGVYRIIFDLYNNPDVLIQEVLDGKPDFLFGSFCSRTGFLQNEEVFNKVYPLWQEVLAETVMVHHRNEWAKRKVSKQFNSVRYFLTSFSTAWAYELTHVLRYYNAKSYTPIKFSVEDPCLLDPDNDFSGYADNLFLDDSFGPLAYLAGRISTVD